MTSMKLAKLCFAIITVASCLPAQPSSAANFAYLSATGGGLACTAAAPCATFIDAFASLVPNSGRILCLDPVADTQGFSLSASNAAFDIDCPAGSWTGVAGVPVLNIVGPNLTLTFRNMAFNGVGGATSAIKVGVNGSGTLIFENCVFANFSGPALDIEPKAAVNVVITNSRISSNGAGVLLKPTAGGNINVTVDHVRITQNSGGGIKIDTTNGPVTTDLTDSEISGNTSNGMNAVGGAGGPAMFSISRSVIAKNGLAGVQVNGATAAAMIDTTLLDSNAGGATSVGGGGHLLTYGNNRIVGTAGSGFTGPASLQ